MTTADTQDVVTPADSRNGEAGRLCVQRLVRHRRPYTQADMERAKLLFAEKKKLCAIPGNCAGCGKPNDRTNRKTCTKCCKRMVARSRERMEERAVVMQGETVTKLESALRMIFQLRRELNALHASFKLMRHSRAYLYQKAYKSGKRRGIVNGVKAAAKFQERLEAGDREESFGEITRQELATMNHAYDNDA